EPLKNPKPGTIFAVETGAILPIEHLMTDYSQTDRVLISVATFNERDNLSALVSSIFNFVPETHVLIVDDASPDGTGDLADELARTDQRVHVQHRHGKLGLGSAIIAGMKHAIDHRFDRFVSMDADFSHDPKYLPALVDLGTR